MKRILIFSVAYYPFSAGAETAVKEITDRILDAEFDMVTVNLSGTEKKYEKIGNINVHRVGSGKLGKYLFPFLGYFKASALRKKKQFDITWAIMASYAGFAALFFKLFNPKIPFYLSLHEGHSIERIKRRAWFVYPLFRLIFRKANSIIAISNYLADFSVSMGFKNKPSVLSNGIDISLFTEPLISSERKKFRQSLGLREVDVVLLTTSRLIFRNGIADVIRALPKMPPNTRLVICGSGPEEDALKELVSNLHLNKKVFFKGFVLEKDMPMYFKSCDIFIRPSLSEIPGNSFISAFASRIPVVATLMGGIEDYLIDGKTGYVCQPENPESISLAVRRLLKDPHRYQIIERAFTQAAVKYGWKNLAMAMKKNFRIPINIAVVGAGIFGSTISIKLSQNDSNVSLIEKEDSILKAASGINQYRLHRGYHYPRSLSTAISSKESENSFLKEYSEAIVSGVEHYYCIAKEKSKVSAEEFLDFCDKCGLEYEKVTLDSINKDKVELVIKGKEVLINPLRLREIVLKNIKDNRVELFLNKKFIPEETNLYDFTINCSYASLNSVLEGKEISKREYQFEICEKPVLKLPEIFKGKSIVVLDGPFMCIDPYAETDFHVMGNVVHAIHSTNTGFYPIVPIEFSALLNKGIIKNPPITNINKMIKSASEFMPEISKAEHIGSMYTVRTVLPNVDSTDERPTLVNRLNEQVINVFSGKIGNSVKAAEQVLSIINAK